MEHANENQSGFSGVVVLIGLAVVILICFAGWYIADNKDTTIQTTSSKPQDIGGEAIVTSKGKIVSMDLSRMASDGPGLFTIKTASQNDLTVDLIGGESNCDKDAIKVPDVKIGDEVSIKGVKSSDGSLVVCTAGTYIK
jgi:hypothetical protein